MELSCRKALSASLYQELGDDEFRFLILRPSQSFTAPLHVTLHTTTFWNQPVYKALSYVWGSPTVTSTIIVNGINFEGTTNLVSALRHIRKTRIAEVLWVDAVCINQLDITERSHQVQMMPKIYKSAREVIAWLGETKDNSEEAINLLAQWGTALGRIDIKHYDDVRSRLGWFQREGNAESFMAGIKRPFCKRAWNALLNLYERPYWRRLWIFQEFVLANKVTVKCGQSELEADHLITDVFLTVWEEFFPSCGLVGTGDFEMVREKLLSLQEERRMIHNLLRWRGLIQTGRGTKIKPAEGVRITLFDLLWDMSRRDCADPRDYLFAMSGIRKEEAPIVVDYSLTEEETYAEFAQSCIVRSDLQVLCFAGIGYTDKPPWSRYRRSWSPDWNGSARIRAKSRFMPMPFQYKCYSSGTHTNSTGIASCGGNDQTYIVVPGRLYDNVAEVLEGWSDWELPKDARWKDLLRKQSRDTRYVTGMPLLQAYFRTLLADVDPHWQMRLEALHEQQEKDNDVDRAIYGGFVVNFLKQYCIEGNGAFCNVKKENLMAELRDEIDIPSLDMGSFFRKGERPSRKRWSQWLHNAKRHTDVFTNARRMGSQGRSFFTTSQGYMGTGPPFAKKGDIVCIFQDANIPFLLRKDDKGYRLVGEVFVLGMMDGEVAGTFESVVLF